MNIHLRVSNRRNNFRKNSFPLFLKFTIFLALILFWTVQNLTFLAYAHSQATINPFTLEKKDELILFPPKTITLIKGETTNTYLTYSYTLKDFFEEYNIEYSRFDIVTPSLDSRILANQIATIEEVEKEYEDIIINIPFDKEIIYDDSLTYGQREIVQNGLEGEKKHTYQYVYIDNILAESVIYNSVTITNPTKHIERVGTKKTPKNERNCPHWYSVINTLTTNEEERDILKFLISCETHCNAGANNNNLYLGLLQFSQPTFNHYSNGGDIWSGEDQIKAALRIIRSGGFQHHWPGCAYRYYNS